jgi:hypothetical protein
LKKSLVAVPTAAIIGLSTLGLVSAGTASAAPPTTETAVNISAKAKTVKQKAKKFGISKKNIKRYKLKNWELRQIRQSKRWAKTSKTRSVRNCESNNRYSINTRNGYYGAYQFSAETWRGIGGNRYSSYAHQSSKMAQDHMAWKLWRSQGWGPWSCA